MNDKNIKNWENLQDEELLNFRLCELHLTIKGTELEIYVQQLYQELTQKNIVFYPVCYLADEWLCPDLEPVIGIPFYLAHSRLKKVEHKMMLDVEGETRASCMCFLRHEAGHTINYAYRLYRRKRWKELFGLFSKDYPEKYRFRPYSKSYVRHLEDWYAQYHPDEDFAETFAVWLTPKSKWREEYRGWKALEKLEYVDRLMKEISNKQPLIKTGKKLWQASRLRLRLKTYYRRKRKLYEEEYPDFHDSNLTEIFFSAEFSPSTSKASSFLEHQQKQVLDNVSMWTGEKKYIINRIIKDLIKRCNELNLYTGNNECNTVSKVTAYITTLIMNYLYTGGFKKGR
ncbi:hypothetical protein KAU39_06705 [bacterium]|nr:hypothetical protein [bacterium]